MGPVLVHFTKSPDRQTMQRSLSVLEGNYALAPQDASMPMPGPINTPKGIAKAWGEESP